MAAVHASTFALEAGERQRRAGWNYPGLLEPAVPSDKRTRSRAMCAHQPPCPPVGAPDRVAARTIASHPEQGWSLLCNGVVLFEDTGALLPDGRVIAPHQPTGLCAAA
jgi:hypothetical protein